MARYKIDCPSCKGEGKVRRLVKFSLLKFSIHVKILPCKRCGGEGRVWSKHSSRGGQYKIKFND